MADKVVQDPIDELKVWMIAARDRVPMRVDAAYVFSQTDDNRSDALTAAAGFYHDNRTERICCAQAGPYQADASSPVSFGGFEAWRRTLTDYRVGAPDIVGVPINDETWHCGVEAQEFIRLASGSDWKRVAIIAPAFHIARCFVNAVTFATQFEPRVRVYAVCVPVAWNEVVLHSQGHVRGTRLDLLAGERERVNLRYGNQYDLLDYPAVLEYVKWRDSQ